MEEEPVGTLTSGQTVSIPLIWHRLPEPVYAIRMASDGGWGQGSPQMPLIIGKVNPGLSEETNTSFL